MSVIPEAGMSASDANPGEPAAQLPDSVDQIEYDAPDGLQCMARSLSWIFGVVRAWGTAEGSEKAGWVEDGAVPRAHRIKAGMDRRSRAEDEDEDIDSSEDEEEDYFDDLESHRWERLTR